MSLPRLVLNSPDLSRLVNEGYAVRIQSGHLLVDDVPFVTSEKQVQRGTMICPLDTQGDSAIKPANHVMWFAGGVPCDKHGNELASLIHARERVAMAEGVVAECSFSQKPSPDGYANYYDKVVTYIGLVIGHAQVLEPGVTAGTFKPVATDEHESVFRYIDTASSRAGITAHTDKLALQKVVIVGLGGTGSYLLDQLAKLPIAELHLYDGDVFATHNAFRAPGAASIEELNARQAKVHYHASRYEPLRRGIHPHPVYITAENVDELLTMDFVFLSMDPNEHKKLIVDRLTDSQVPFTDTGIGILNDTTGLGGLIRVTTSLPGKRAHIDDGHLISYAAGGGDDYESNIQVAELNALTAVLAIIAFKKKSGFYRDQEHELHTLYAIDGNYLVNRYGDSAGEGG
jgi:hypothetical protein